MGLININTNFFFIIKVFSFLAIFTVFQSISAHEIFITVTFMRKIISLGIGIAWKRIARQIRHVFWPLASLILWIVDLLLRAFNDIGMSIFAYAILVTIFMKQIFRGIKRRASTNTTNLINFVRTFPFFTYFSVPIKVLSLRTYPKHFVPVYAFVIFIALTFVRTFLTLFAFLAIHIFRKIANLIHTVVMKAFGAFL